MIFKFIAVLAVMFCATIAFAQESRGTPEQRAACTPDAFRLCSGYIPDPTGVEYCLRQNKSMRIDRFSSKAPAQWLAEANN